MKVDMTNVEAIAHTHPFFSMAYGRRRGFDARAANRANRNRGYKDHLPIEKNGVPNYLRTPKGGAVKVVERVNNEIRVRLVWTKDGGYQ